MREFATVSVYPVSVILMILASAAYLTPSALVFINITKPMRGWIVLEFKFFIRPLFSVNRNNFKPNFNLLMDSSDGQVRQILLRLLLLWEESLFPLSFGRLSKRERPTRRRKKEVSIDRSMIILFSSSAFLFFEWWRWREKRRWFYMSTTTNQTTTTTNQTTTMCFWWWDQESLSKPSSSS